MKKSTIITILAFALGIVVLTVGFVLLTDNNISNSIFTTTTTTTTAASGSSDPDALQPMDFFKEDVLKYVTLGQYKDLVIEAEVVEINDEFVDLQLHYVLYQENNYTKATEGTVKECYVFNFDYKGYINGVPFSGGEAADNDAYIENGVFYLADGTTFIDGFAQGMLGAEVGKEFDVTTQFPEDYHNEDYAGKTAVFKVKVNYLVKTEPTDEWVATYTSNEYTTVASFKEYIKEYLEDTIKSEYIGLIWAEITKNMTVIEIPQQEFDYIYSYYREQVEYYAMMYGTTYENMLQQFGYANDAALQQYVSQTVKDELVVYAVMQAEGIEVTDEEYEEFMLSLVESAGVTKEELEAQYGAEYIKHQIMFNKVDELVWNLNHIVPKSE